MFQNVITPFHDAKLVFQPSSYKSMICVLWRKAEGPFPPKVASWAHKCQGAIKCGSSLTCYSVDMFLSFGIPKFSFSHFQRMWYDALKFRSEMEFVAIAEDSTVEGEITPRNISCDRQHKLFVPLLHIFFDRERKASTSRFS